MMFLKLLVVVALCFPDRATAQCEAPFSPVSTQCMICPTDSDSSLVGRFQEAVQDCAKIGASLAPIYDQAQQTFAEECGNFPASSYPIFIGVVKQDDIYSLNGTAIDYLPGTTDLDTIQACTAITDTDKWETISCSTQAFKYVCAKPLARCPKLDEPDSSSVTYVGGSIDIDGTTYYDVNSVATTKCDAGFTASSGNTVRMCTGDGSWSGVPVVCSEVECAIPENPANGAVEVIENSVAVYSCNEGFSMTTGDPVHTCNAAGEWTGVVPSCTVIVEADTETTEATPSDETLTAVLGALAAGGVAMAVLFGILAAMARSNMVRVPRLRPRVQRATLY